jgi:DNA-binding NarL/FixJ family response regulator
LVPGLLQTEDHACAVIRAFRPHDDDEGTDRRVAVRHQRQQRVTEERSLQISAVLGEGVVHQLVGSRSVTAAQLRFLAEINDLPNVMIQAQLLVRRQNTPVDRLTGREREVLGLMAEGRSNAGIAEKLVVSESAVAKHINSIFTKLDLPASEGDHRRVLAVLRFLERTSPTT